MNGVLLTIVGMVVGKQGVTLYTDSGSELQLSNEGWRTKDIVQSIAIPLAVEGSAPLNLSDFSLGKKLEEMTGGEVKVVGTDPTIGGADYKVVAKDGTEIAGKQIETQLERAVFGKGAKGFAAFMRFYGDISRKHSAEDLLTFMQRGKMHIADDGTIIAYKSLNTKDKHFVDVHTGKVLQDVGTRVEMDEKDVDPDRGQDCSYGLHIATNSYIPNFGGDVLVLVKIRPQDVIAVPTYDNTKMRVCRYDIVIQVPPAIERKVRSGSALDEFDEGRAFLARIIAGDHAPIARVVRVDKNGNAKGEALKKPIVPEVNEVRDLNNVAPRREAVKPKEVNELVNAAITGNLATALNSAVEDTKPVPQVTANADYQTKFQNAVDLFKSGKSIRDIAKVLRMDRESLGKKLRAMGLLK